MERIISEEDRLRRAEEISARRQNRISAESINVRKKMSKLGKLFIQVITSIVIFGILYFLTQNNSVAIEKIKPIIATDTDFIKIYNDINNIMFGIINENASNQNNDQTSNQIIDEDNSLNSEDETNKRKEDDIEENNKDNNKEELSNQEDNNSESNNLEQNNLGENKQQDNSETVSGVGGGDDKTQTSETMDDITYIKSKVSFIKPVSGTITSPYGERTPTDIVSANHAGIDIGTWNGADIIASMEGTVELVSTIGDYGNHLKITNGDISTLYAHCSKIIVTEGEHVSQGQKIAEVGSTGKSTGPHLHFEIRRNNTTVDPQKILEI